MRYTIMLDMIKQTLILSSFFSSSSFGFPLVRSAAILMGAERFVATAFQFLFIS